MGNLIEILKSIEKRPGMYFGSRERARSIHVISAFIMGYEFAHDFSNPSTEFKGFTEWVATHYHVLAERDGFGMILEHVGGDEQKAYDEFYQLLPEFLIDKEKLGWERILERFTELQDECMEEFRKELEKESDKEDGHTPQ